MLTCSALESERMFGIENKRWVLELAPHRIWTPVASVEDPDHLKFRVTVIDSLRVKNLVKKGGGAIGVLDENELFREFEKKTGGIGRFLFSM